MVQSLLPAIYPILKTALRLDFGHIGLITLVNQVTASLLQPVIGAYTDRRPLPQSLAIGMSFTLTGLVLLAWSAHFGAVLMAAALIGIGSSVFHPESSRIARLASGGQHGLAQSVFQVGGNAGSAIGPLLAALIVLPRGSAVSCGSRSPPSWRSRCSGASAAGTVAELRAGRASPRPATLPTTCSRAGRSGARLPCCWCWCSRSTSTWPA